jgi:hypothetical protein
LRALSKEEQASLFLTRGGIAFSQEQPTVTANDPGAVCDRMAGSPLDPRKHAPGVPFGGIDAENAVTACLAAIKAAPDEPRFPYQLGRALDRADKPEAAAARFRAAAERGYSCAENNLGFAYEKGRGVAKNDAEALRLYRRAAQDGCAPAFSNIGRFYWDGIGIGVDRAEALRWFERGADQRDPFSHQRLAELYETGDQLPQDFEKALFHHAIELRLLEAAGDTADAPMARARRGSLARALPPEVAVCIAHEAADWRPRGH